MMKRWAGGGGWNLGSTAQKISGRSQLRKLRKTHRKDKPKYLIEIAEAEYYSTVHVASSELGAFDINLRPAKPA
jgi:hypothetical protein